VVFAGPLVKGGPPLPDALQTERVRAVLQDAKLAPLRQNLLDADTALLVSINIRILFLPFLALLEFLLVQVLAFISELAVTLQEILARSELILVAVEVIYDVIIIFHLIDGQVA